MLYIIIVAWSCFSAMASAGPVLYAGGRWVARPVALAFFREQSGRQLHCDTGVSEEGISPELRS